MAGELLLRVLVPGTIPGAYEPRDVVGTSTPGLYVSRHPEGEAGWVLVAQCGRWLANYVRWRTYEDAQAVAAELGDEGIDWTLSDGELFKAYPDFNDRYWDVVLRFDDRRYPTF